MSNVRQKAIEIFMSRSYTNTTKIDTKPSQIFRKNVFDVSSQREFLSKEAFVGVQDAILHEKKIDRKISEQVAAGIKQWAMSKGATHYTHWFQPLTGATAEKHDSFLDTTGSEGIEKFNAEMLVQQEPDASSFPSGGIRNTFEARGYTAWDPTSYAFIMGTTLCIPTIFVSYTGEALDYKIPLLKALSAVDKAATDVAQYFDKSVTKVNSTLGWEQEYFLVDKALYDSRPDLVVCGKTLLGHIPARGQQLDDHYFGSIPTRAMEFMKELEVEALKLGIPVTTRHNEVAPNQFEIAPIFEETNLSVDHNSLVVDLMGKVAVRHNLRVLVHEKPFAQLNGSGKHNNWSLSTNTGINLLGPGRTPRKNLQFLTFFVNTIKAVHDYDDLLRASIASVGNDLRLGANEAPPAIISAFIGSQLTKVLEELENVSEGKLGPDEKTRLKLDLVGKIPEVLLDNTDRNRTSPFAFTGNKFEFRAVGSSANCALPMMVLNTAVADTLTQFKKDVDGHIEKGLKKDEAIFNVLRDYIKASKRILFEGDGYSQEWVEEAEKRGLNNRRTTPEALDFYLEQKSIDLFERNGVLSKVELEARNEIMLETYMMRVQIESRTLGDMARNHVVPTAVRYQKELIGNVQGLKDVLGDEYLEYAKEDINIIKQISTHKSVIIEKVEEMIEKRKEINALEDTREKALKYCSEVLPYFEEIRYHCDKLEIYVDDNMWPLTKYRELLLYR